MATEARHHHYMPQCYLRGFSVGAGKKCRVTVANLENDVFFETNPRNVAGVRDFNRVELPGFKPDALEGMLSGFESEVAAAIRNIVASKKFEEIDRNAVLNLIALLAVRSPQMREHWRIQQQKVFKRIIGLSLEAKERWESQQEAMKKAGYGVDAAVSYEDMVKFYKEDEYDIAFKNEHHIGVEFKVHDSVLRALDARKWSLYITDDGNGCFVTADRPVMLTYNKPEEVPLLFRNSPGFGVPETEVLFPLTQHLALVGEFEGEDRVMTVPTEIVAMANSKMILGSFGQVYAPKKTIPYVGPDRKTYFDRNFMDRYSQYKKENEKQPA